MMLPLEIRPEDYSMESLVRLVVVTAKEALRFGAETAFFNSTTGEAGWVKPGGKVLSQFMSVRIAQAIANNWTTLGTLAADELSGGGGGGNPVLFSDWLASSLPAAGECTMEVVGSSATNDVDAVPCCSARFADGCLKVWKPDGAHAELVLRA
jgi:hypothetical protein